MAASVLHAFWSYSRASEAHGGEELHSAMQTALDETLAPRQIHIFRDSSLASGIGSGVDWRRALVRGIARSTIFFWVQSPLWVHRPVCRFEFFAFRDRVRRLASRLSKQNDAATFDDLWAAMVVPIRWAEIADDQWRGVPAEQRRVLSLEWNRMGVLSPLMLAEKRRRLQRAVNDAYSVACFASAPVIGTQLDSTLRRIGASWSSWERLIAVDVAEFEEFWLSRPEVQSLAGAASEPTDLTTGVEAVGAQLTLAHTRTAGRLNLERPELGLTMVLLPDLSDPEGGYWCSNGPLPNRLAKLWAARFGPDAKGKLGTSGTLVWSESAMRVLLPQLQEYAIDIPNAAQAETLAALCAKGRDSIHQLGLLSAARGFWFNSAEGRLATHGAGAATGPLVVVSRLAGCNHA